jgi:hypothetical protein
MHKHLKSKFRLVDHPLRLAIISLSAGLLVGGSLSAQTLKVALSAEDSEPSDETFIRNGITYTYLSDNDQPRCGDSSPVAAEVYPDPSQDPTDDDVLEVLGGIDASATRAQIEISNPQALPLDGEDFRIPEGVARFTPCSSLGAPLPEHYDNKGDLIFSMSFTAYPDASPGYRCLETAWFKASQKLVNASQGQPVNFYRINQSRSRAYEVVMTRLRAFDSGTKKWGLSAPVAVPILIFYSYFQQNNEENVCVDREQQSIFWKSRQVFSTQYGRQNRVCPNDSRAKTLRQLTQANPNFACTLQTDQEYAEDVELLRLREYEIEGTLPHNVMAGRQLWCQNTVVAPEYKGFRHTIIDPDCRE